MMSKSYSIPPPSRNELLLSALMGALIGAVAFFIIYPAAVVNPMNDHWLLSGNDLTQHYLGWKFYRATPWQFPLGMIENLIYPARISIIYTDSIPLLALLFKLLSPLLPYTFQYFGLHGLLSYILMGVFSAILVRRYCPSILGCLCGCVLFVFSPYVLQRCFYHTALSSQWLILAGFIVLVYRQYFSPLRRRLFVWSLLFALAATIHLYFVPMLFVMLVGDCLQDFFSVPFFRQLRRTLLLFTTVLPSLLLLYLLGAFSGGIGYTGGGLGGFSSNLNTFWNPLIQLNPFVLALPTIDEGQYEGFGYLGAGVMLLAALAALYFVWQLLHKQCPADTLPVPALLFTALCHIVLALSPYIFLNDKKLFSIPWPPFIMRLLLVFRASGRFIWPVCYLIVFCAITLLMRAPRRPAVAVLCGCTLLQLYNLSGMLVAKHALVASFFTNDVDALYEKAWDSLGAQYKHFVFIPYDYVTTDSSVGFAVANFALEHGMTTSSFYLARTNESQAQAYQDACIQALDTGSPQSDTIYVFNPDSDSFHTAWSDCLTMQTLDGILIGTAK